MKTIKIKSNCLGRYDDVSPFPIGDLSVCIEGLKDYGNTEYRFLAYINGKLVLTAAITAVDNQVLIPQKELTAGEFTCKVQSFIRGNLAETFAVEPLIITAIDTGYRADPQFEALRRSVEELKRDNAALTERVAAITDELVVMNKNVLELFSFARECIAKSIYLNQIKITEAKYEK